MKSSWSWSGSDWKKFCLAVAIIGSINFVLIAYYLSFPLIEHEGKGGPFIYREIPAWLHWTLLCINLPGIPPAFAVDVVYIIGMALFGGIAPLSRDYQHVSLVISGTLTWGFLVARFRLRVSREQYNSASQLG